MLVVGRGGVGGIGMEGSMLGCVWTRRYADVIGFIWVSIEQRRAAAAAITQVRSHLLAPALDAGDEVATTLFQ